MAQKLDKELQEFRDLMTPPDKFEEGFSWVSLLGAIFIGLLMVPGNMYMQLVAGLDIGGAARWVTVILFLEIARRTHKSLKNAEIFVLFYMAAAATAVPFKNLLFRQFLVQSKAFVAQGWQDQVPAWFAPTDPAILGERSFFMAAWLVPVGLIMLTQVISRLDSRILGFGLFKITSDFERLPFPLAPIGAQGIMALAEEEDESSWRWRAFSIGGAIGLVFGGVYMGVPIISNAVLGVTFQPLPIPFVDWTSNTEAFLPAVATGYSFDLTHFIFGMVMPFWAVAGAFASLLFMFVLNPVFYNAGILDQWRPGDDTIMTLFKNMVDFYFSFGIGTTAGIAIIGIYSVIRSVRRARAESADKREAYSIPPERGNIPNWAIIGMYFLSCSIYVGLSGFLIGWHSGVMVFLCIYAFLYMPIISYVTARLEGICGQALQIPLAREIGFILSGYQGLAVWFIPIPLSDYGRVTMFYRKAELTGTRFASIWKADAILVPFILICTIVFANFIWSMAPIPSEAYPYTEKIWEFEAMKMSLMYSATAGEGEWSMFNKALNGWYILVGFGVGTIGYGVLSLLGAPTLLYYGFVRGLNKTLPHTALPAFIGACLGRFYMQRKFGSMWRKYIPVVAAGFSCGMGLISMMSIGLTFLKRAIFTLSY